MPTVLCLGPYRFFFYATDRDGPLHIHVERDDKVAKFWLDPLKATSRERNNWRLIGKGQGIHWEDLDEDISVEGLLAGKTSGESQASLRKWLEGRGQA